MLILRFFFSLCYLSYSLLACLYKIEKIFVSAQIIDIIIAARHFSSYQESKLSVTQRKGRYSAVESSQLSWAGQYNKCVPYDFQFTLEYSA